MIDKEGAGIIAALIAAAIAAWVALKKQNQVDVNSTVKQWKMYAAHLEEQKAALESELSQLRVQRTTDAVTIAVLQQRLQGEKPNVPDAQPHP